MPRSGTGHFLSIDAKPQQKLAIHASDCKANGLFVSGSFFGSSNVTARGHTDDAPNGIEMLTPNLHNSDYCFCIESEPSTGDSGTFFSKQKCKLGLEGTLGAGLRQPGRDAVDLVHGELDFGYFRL
jgi:hypothetical protein